MKTPVDDYLEKRIRPRIAWYDRRASQCKLVYFFTQYIAAAASVVVILLLHFETVPRGIVAVVAAVVAVLLGAERIGQFGGLWRTYRMAAEVLEMETQLHAHGAGPYAVTGSQADRLLVERAEQIMADEADRWLSATLAGKTAADETRS